MHLVPAAASIPLTRLAYCLAVALSCTACVHCQKSASFSGKLTCADLSREAGLRMHAVRPYSQQIVNPRSNVSGIQLQIVHGSGHVDRD